MAYAAEEAQPTVVWRRNGCPAIRGDGYNVGPKGKGKSGLRYNISRETRILQDCLTTWVRSKHCCPHSCGDLCGIVLLHKWDSGRTSNLLFERCAEHGGDGHDETWETYKKESKQAAPPCALIYGYSLQDDGPHLNSGTFNGDEMPDELYEHFPSIIWKTRSEEHVQHDVFAAEDEEEDWEEGY